MNDLSSIEAQFGDLSQYQKSPDFWLADPRDTEAFLETLTQFEVREIGKSAGGLSIKAIFHGEFEPLETITDNLHSAIASRIDNADPTDIFPAAFYGTHRRKNPVVVLQGGIHGGEVVGTVASLNLCHIIEHGTDLRGKAWPRLRELALKVRLVIIPWLNPDGNYRWPIPNIAGAPAELVAQCTHGIKMDGTPYRYPEYKVESPIDPDQCSFLGCYNNDNGVNLQYDIFSLPRQPETESWMKLYLEERPDGVLIFHCNAGTLIGPACYYLPPGHQHEESRLGGVVRYRLNQEGFALGRMSLAGLPSLGKPFFTQMDAVYHVSGATPIMVEFPNGSAAAPFMADEMLDIGLITIEETLHYALTDGLRPYEWLEKVNAKR
jgi:hypothetical protein